MACAVRGKVYSEAVMQMAVHRHSVPRVLSHNDRLQAAEQLSVA